MSYAPVSIRALAAVWTAYGGVNLGIVGDVAHIRTGKSYHLGKDTIKLPAYSVHLARDVAGFTNAASALDLGHADKRELRKFSVWFVNRCRTNAAGTRDVRDVIYSADGVTVLRWDRERGYISSPQAGEADRSHLTHTHISFYRDSEDRTKTGLFLPYFPAIDTVPVVESDMILTSYLPGYTAMIKLTANIRSAPQISVTTVIRAVAGPPESWIGIGWVKGDVDPDGGSDQWFVRWSGTRFEYTAKSNLTAPPVAPVGETAALEAKLKSVTDLYNSAAAAAKVADASAKVAAVSAKVADASAKVAAESAKVAEAKLVYWDAYKAAHVKVGL